MLESTWSYFTTWTLGWVGQTHLVTALLALGSGAWVLWAPKGTRTHVAWGYVYLLSMLALNLTALAKYDLTGGFNMFHAAAIGSLATLSAAFGASMVFRRRRTRLALVTHGQLMIWSYFGLFAALVAEVVTRAVPWMLHGEGGWSRFSLALAAFMVLTGVLTHRFAQQATGQRATPETELRKSRG